ncbi:BnaA02g11960D [Brassica napus]|uniref:BnaA02g11960D protein n=1 Tax=Brassica napus TaxID=3708 RepID=A0A078FU66_BRANA|nr:BnaA02g11960D [Brassica napus]
MNHDVALTKAPLLFPSIVQHLIIETEPSKVQEAEKMKETDPAPPMEAEEPNAACVSALHMILESLMRTTMFSCDVPITLYPETHERFIQDYLDQFYHLFLDKLSLMEENGGVSEILINVLEIMPGWNRHLGFEDRVKMKCTRCKMDTLYPPPQPSFDYGFGYHHSPQSAFEDFTFERILKVIKINSMVPCKTEGCEKLSYVDHIIPTLPSVFTIALEWENNETEEEILATTSVLATEIDISEIYKYEGGSPETKYNLVSMVCSHGDQYACVAYFNNRWVIYFPSEQQVIGDWDSVINTFIRLNMRPDILFFENDMQRKRIVNAQINTPSDVKNTYIQKWDQLQNFMFSLQPQSS